MSRHVKALLYSGSALLLALMPAAPGAAREDLVRTDKVRAGPYVLIVGFLSDPPHVENPLDLNVRADSSGASLDGAVLTLTGLPGLGTDATPTRPVELKGQVGEPDSYAGAVSFTVRGAWNLRLDIKGRAGEGTALLPVTVAAPAAVPVWLGWLIGMSPLLGVAWFAWWNRRYLVRLRMEEARGR